VPNRLLARILIALGAIESGVMPLLQRFFAKPGKGLAVVQAV
jgi:hypothetical protein